MCNLDGDYAQTSSLLFFNSPITLSTTSSSLSLYSSSSNHNNASFDLLSDHLEFQDYDLSIEDGSDLSNASGLDTEWLIKFIPSITIYTIIFIMGFFGNLLVIVSICYLKRLQSITNMFLLSLATADFLLIIICVPIKIIEFFTHRWLFGFFMCKLFHYMQFFTAICSVINLTSMSLERYLAILHPFKAKYTCTRKRAKIIILFIWILSIIAALPILLGKKVVQVGLKKDVDICIRVWCETEWKVFEIYRSLLILVIPFSIMLITYTKICIELWKMPKTRRFLVEASTTQESINTKVSSVKSNQNKEPSQTPDLKLTVSLREVRDRPNRDSRSIRQDDIHTRKQIIKMLICIIIIFFISWTPITMNNLLVSFKVLSNINTGMLWYFRLTFYTMSYINSCVNPIVYAFMSKNFREAFKHIFIKICSVKKGDNGLNNRRLAEINRNNYINNNNLNYEMKILLNDGETKPNGNHKSPDDEINAEENNN